MSIQITMPALSPTMEEGNLSKWHVKAGDKIEPGQVIAEIETDKATMEVEAVDEGVIAEILVPEGSQGVKVNTPIAVLAGEGEAPRPAKQEEPLQAKQQPSTQRGEGREEVRTTGRSPSERSTEPSFRQRRSFTPPNRRPRPRRGRGEVLRFPPRAPPGRSGRHRSFRLARHRPQRPHRQERYRIRPEVTPRCRVAARISRAYNAAPRAKPPRHTNP